MIVNFNSQYQPIYTQMAVSAPHPRRQTSSREIAIGPTASLLATFALIGDPLAGDTARSQAHRRAPQEDGSPRIPECLRRRRKRRPGHQRHCAGAPVGLSSSLRAAARLASQTTIHSTPQTG